MNDKFNELRSALDKKSADRLQFTDPDIFDALEIAIIRGATAEDVKAFIKEWTGGERTSYYNMEQAARFLLNQKVKA